MPSRVGDRTARVAERLLRLVHERRADLAEAVLLAPQVAVRATRLHRGHLGRRAVERLRGLLVAPRRLVQRPHRDRRLPERLHLRRPIGVAGGIQLLRDGAAGRDELLERRVVEGVERMATGTVSYGTRGRA